MARLGALLSAVALVAALGCGSAAPATSPHSPQTASTAEPVSATAAPTGTPAASSAATPTPVPPPTPAAAPVKAPPPPPQAPAACQAQAPGNPFGYDFCPGSLVYSPPGNVCSYFNCIPSFWRQTNGYFEECSDGAYSHSGGRQGACSYHGGELRPVYAH
jgi:hypothetical protein